MSCCGVRYACCQLVGCTHNSVYFWTWFVLGVGSIAPFGHVKPNRPSQVQVLQRAADLAQGLRADMCVDLSGFAGSVPQ